VADLKALEIHKALADDTRFRLYRYLGLTGRPVSVRELARRLSLHPNTLRPHLRHLERAGLVSREIRRGASVGRPQTMYSIVVAADATEDGDYRLLSEILLGAMTGKRGRERATELAREWGGYLASRGVPKPGVRVPAGRNLAAVQEAMARAGFDPRFRRQGRDVVEVLLRDCPFRDLVEDHRELVCAVHLGLLEGMLAAVKPALQVREFRPFAERAICILVAAG
jgi:predicted ArsR family transcriptional regulator